MNWKEEYVAYYLSLSRTNDRQICRREMPHTPYDRRDCGQYQFMHVQLIVISQVGPRALASGGYLQHAPEQCDTNRRSRGRQDLFIFTYTSLALGTVDDQVKYQ